VFMSRPCLSHREHRPTGRNAEALRKDWTKNYKFKKACSDGNLAEVKQVYDEHPCTNWYSAMYQTEHDHTVT